MNESTLDGLALKNLSKSFGPTEVLRDVSVEVARGEFFSLLGPSGCGKTTILRMIAGFEPCGSGEIWFGGTLLNGIPPHRRPVNTVFQNYALFPHMSVTDNVAFGLKIRKLSPDVIRGRVAEMLELVNLPGYAGRSIGSLSGGEKQRVALARALVNGPEILLLDEPLAALDLQLRRKVQFEIKEIHRKVGTTFVYVTHDQEEALAMSDRIAVLTGGRVEQVGTPQQIYDRPDSRFVARFIGASNLLEGKVVGRQPGEQTVKVDVSGLGLFETSIRNGAGPGQAVGLLLRPEKIQLVHDNARAQGFSGTVEETLYMGALIRYRVRVGPAELLAVEPASAQRVPIRPGQRVKVRWAPSDMVVVDR